MERAFGGFGPELDVRPIRHRLADRVRAHVFLRMLSYYVAWHMKEALAPLLFKDDDKEAALAARPGPVAPAVRSAKALPKIARKRTDDGWPAHSFETLLKDLGTICAATIEPIDSSVPPFQEGHPPPPSSVGPSSCSGSPTASGTPRSQGRPRLLSKSPGCDADVQLSRGNFGLGPGAGRPAQSTSHPIARSDQREVRPLERVYIPVRRWASGPLPEGAATEPRNLSRRALPRN